MLLKNYEAVLMRLSLLILALSIKKIKIRQRQLIFLLYGTDQPQFLANQNNSTDFTWKYFLYNLFFECDLFLLGWNKIVIKTKN